MRVLRPSPKGVEIKAGMAFHITKVAWSYARTRHYVARIHALGWGFQGTVNAITKKSAHALRDGKGRLVRDHFNQPGRFIADMQSEQYRRWYVESMQNWAAIGADALQRDEPTALRKSNLAEAKRFFVDLRERLAGSPAADLPISLNIGGNGAALRGDSWQLSRMFDFIMTEIHQPQLTPGFFHQNGLDGEQKRRMFAYTAGSTFSLREHRLAAAASYANGANYIVPWDQFTGVDTPRYFARPEDIADLYGFVRGVSDYLDDYKPSSRLDPLRHRQQDALANELFGNSAFTVFMVTRSKDPSFGITGNANNAGGQIPRLYMLRGSFSYNLLNAASNDSTPGETEISVFAHNGKQSLYTHRQCDPQAMVTAPDLAAKTQFGHGVLSIPFQASDQNHAGDLAELIVFRGEVDQMDLQETCRYLHAKYLSAKIRKPTPPGILRRANLHLSAETLAQTYTDGQSIQRWPAKTGQIARVPRVTLPNGSRAEAPVFVANSVNGKPSVRFDGIDDLLRIDDGIPEYQNESVGVVGGSGSLHAFVRTKHGDAQAPVVVHLIDWSRYPKPAQIDLRPARWFPGKSVTVSLLTPAPYKAKAHRTAEANARQSLSPGERMGPSQSDAYSKLVARKELKTTRGGNVTSVEIPALAPWGILLVSPTTE